MPKPLLQLALDTYDLPSALAPLQQAAPYIDVIEVGTILCLSEGMGAVRIIRSLFPDKTILADVRIAEAGGIIAKMAFEAGADWVSVVSGAAPSTAEVVHDVARQHGGEVQIELSDGWTWEQAAHWRDIGIEQAIVHRSRDAEAQGELAWGSADLDNIRRLADMGYRVTVAGGVGVNDVSTFAGIPVHIFISGRAIRNASDPAAAAADFQEAIHRNFSAQRREA
ncbi:MAG: 3-keto-L-gulonate-6-phosphate decarboxylase UlaD [Chloroflexi bacterium]|nr:3-keto-L-gulonate-6-phosphate decarboxylase UlaD [Chloroflexota bacterium]